MTTPKKKISFDLEPFLIEDLKEFANLLNTKQSDLLREAIYTFMNQYIQYISIFVFENDNLVEKKIDIINIDKIDNYKIDEKLLNFGFKSYGKITTILGDKYKFLSIYEINNEKIEKIKMNVAKIDNDLKSIQKRKKFDI